MRAVSVIPAASNEYMTDQRYTAPAPAPLHASSTPGPGLRYVEEVGPTPAPPREIYVDQYGREVRRVGYWRWTGFNVVVEERIWPFFSFFLTNFSFSASSNWVFVVWIEE
jgi:hypothetical protein